jgi:multiple sugar transport system permease protein
MTATARPARRRARRMPESAVAACFIAPAVLAMLVLRLAPALGAIWSSLDVPGGLGFGNFIFLFGDPEFLGALKVTLLYTVLVNPIQIALALGLALLLNETLPAGGLWRTLILLPVGVPQSVSAIIWGVILRPDGPLNAVLQAIGIGAQPFLTSPTQSLACIILICSWVGVGYWMTFLIAGLKDIPISLYEAAAIDGANFWQRLVYITLPQLRRPLTFVLVADTVSNFLVFAPVQILTKGGPDGSTNLIMNEIYTRAFVSGDATGAAAGTVVLVFVVIAVVAVQFRLMTRKAGEA